MWSPNLSHKRFQSDMCQRFSERPLSAGLLAEMVKALAEARLWHANQGFRATRQTEIDMEVASLLQIRELVECVEYASGILSATAGAPRRRTCQCAGCSGRC
jgi:hypothetical protein